MSRNAAKAPESAIPAWDGDAPGLWFCNWKIWLGRRLLDRALAPLGLRAREFWLLAIAGAGNVPQHEIAELCGLDPSSLVAVVDKMEQRGWLRRQRNPEDRRVQCVSRTEAGDRLFARALPRARRAGRELTRLSPTEQRCLTDAMSRLLTIPNSGGRL